MWQSVETTLYFDILLSMDRYTLVTKTIPRNWIYFLLHKRTLMVSYFVASENYFGASIRYQFIQVHEYSLQWRHNERDCISNHQPHYFCPTVYSGAGLRKHQSSASLAFVRGIHRWPVNPPHEGPVLRKIFHLMTSLCFITLRRLSSYTEIGLIRWYSPVFPSTCCLLGPSVRLLGGSKQHLGFWPALGFPSFEPPLCKTIVHQQVFLLYQHDIPCYSVTHILTNWFRGITANLYNEDGIKWRHFRVTGPLCGEITSHRWIPDTKSSDAELWCFVLSAPE